MNIKSTIGGLTAVAVVGAGAFAAGASSASTTTRTVTRIVRPAPIVVTNTVVKIVRVKVPVVTKTVPVPAAPTPTTAAPRPAQSQYAGWTVENVASFEQQFAATYPMGAYAPNAAALVQNPCAMHWIESHMTYASFENGPGFTPGLPSSGYTHYNLDTACPGWTGDQTH